MMKRLRRAMVTRSASNSASASRLSTCLVRGTFCCWSSPKPLPVPLPSLSAVADACGRSRGAQWARYDAFLLAQLNLRTKSLAGPIPAFDIQRTHHPETRPPPMTDIILHHYDTSPYAEKVRTGLGLKGLAWASVELPQIMPKPNLTALTGGYRKTPVLQIGADIYCDSQLIMRELERRH